MAKKKKKTKKTKKTKSKKSKKNIKSSRKARQVKRKKSKKKFKSSRKARQVKRKKTKSKTKGSKQRIKVFKAPKLLEDSDGKSLIKVSDSWANHAYANKSQYQKKYKFSIKDNDKFWAKEGKRISWIKKYSKIKDIKYSKDDVKIKWYYDGTLNASSNCIDRHLKKNASKTAIIWVGDDPADSKKFHTRNYIKMSVRQLTHLRV